VAVTPDAVLLNGVAHPLDALPGALAKLTETPGDAIVLRPRDGADVQRLTDIVERLRQAGFTRLILVE